MLDVNTNGNGPITNRATATTIVTLVLVAGSSSPTAHACDEGYLHVPPAQRLP